MIKESVVKSCIAVMIVLLLSAGFGSAAFIASPNADLKNIFQVPGTTGNNIEVTHAPDGSGGYLFYSTGAHVSPITITISKGKLKKIAAIDSVIHIDEDGKAKVIWIVPVATANDVSYTVPMTSVCIGCFTGMQNQSYAKLNNSTIAIVSNPLPSSNISSLTLKNITRLDGNGTFQVKTNANGTYSSVWTSGDLSIPFLSTEGNILNFSLLFNNTNTNISCILQVGYTQNSTDISETSVDGFHYTNSSILFDANFTNGTITHTIGDATFLANSRTESVSLNTSLPNATVIRTATQYITTFTGTVDNTTTYFVNITDGYASYSNTSWANVTLDNVSVDQCTNGLSPSPSITDGLVSYWTANGCAKDWNRTSANDGTLYGGMEYNASGHDGSAWQFDGQDDYVDIPNSDAINISTILTIELWFKQNTYSKLLGKDNVANTVGWSVFANTGFFRFGVKNTSSHTWLGTGNTPIINNAWYHGVVVFLADGSDPKLYINGILQTLTNTSVGTLALMSIPNSDETLTIGRSHGFAGLYGFLNGTMDEVHIYNRALSWDEVNATYNASRLKSGTIITNTTFATGQQGWYSNSIVNNLSALINYSIYSSTDNVSYGTDQLLAANNTNYSITQKANNQFLKLILQGTGTNAPIVQSITLHSTDADTPGKVLPNWAVGLVVAGSAIGAASALYGAYRRRMRSNQLIIYSLFRRLK